MVRIPSIALSIVDLEERDLSTEEAEELCSFEEVQAEQLFATWSEAFHNIAIDLSSVGKKTTDFFYVHNIQNSLDVR